MIEVNGTISVGIMIGVNGSISVGVMIGVNGTTRDNDRGLMGLPVQWDYQCKFYPADQNRSMQLNIILHYVYWKVVHPMTQCSVLWPSTLPQRTLGKISPVV